MEKRLACKIEPEDTFNNAKWPRQAGSLFYPFGALSLAQGRALLFGESSNVQYISKTNYKGI
jgi:hypothetical protein